MSASEKAVREIAFIIVDEIGVMLGEKVLDRILTEVEINNRSVKETIRKIYNVIRGT